MRLLVLGVASFLLFGPLCDTTDPNVDVYEYKVQVDSIDAPSSAMLGDTVVIRLFGTIASDGCSGFARFEDSTNAREWDLTVWAFRKPAAACPTVMVYLEGEEYEFVVTQAGQATVTIHQPNGSTLKHSISVH